MSKAKKASGYLKNKVNIIPLINRFHQSCAEDFKELAEIGDDHAERIDSLDLDKASVSGSEYEVFKVSDPVSLSDAVNKRFLFSAISELVGSSPEALNTLSELADALGDDPNFATTVTTALGNRLRVDINSQYLSETQKTNALKNLGIDDYVNNRYLKIANAFFTWAKKPSNNTNSIAVNEVITNGRISDTIHIYSAVYVSGDATNFGTLENHFEDGSYKNVSYEKF